MPKLVVNLRDARPLWTVPDWALDEIARAAPSGLDVTAIGALADGRGDGGAASREAIDAMRDAEIFVGYGFPPALLEAARAGGDTLRWVHSAAAGVLEALHDRMRASSILLTNSAGIHAEPMADSVVAAILYFARGLDFAVRAQREGRWYRDPFDAADTPVHELRGRTVGVVGYGGIGGAVADRALALGMRVLAYRRRALPVAPGIELVQGSGGLERVLSESQYVVLSLPRTAETEYLLNRKRLALLRPDAVLVNVGRGELVDEEALVEVLESGLIRGAALDVFTREPLPPESPFWALPNVLVTPHVSATTDGFWRREVDLIVENLGRYERGEPLLNLVDKGAGY